MFDPTHPYHMDVIMHKRGWHESRTIDRKRKTASRCVITYRGMHINFEICCVWLIDRFKWMLNSESLGIHANLIAEAGKISKDEVKLKALAIIKNYMTDRMTEIEDQIRVHTSP